MWAVVLGALTVVVVGVGVWLVSASEAAGVPDEFTNRSSLPDCGRADVTAGPPDAGGKEAIDCFDAALADGDGAELVVVHSTAEGDPVTEYYRALPDGGGVEIFSDNRQDAFRGVDWHHASCPEARSYLERGDCGYRDL
jgi:hypothetical protein